MASLPRPSDDDVIAVAALHVVIAIFSVEIILAASTFQDIGAGTARAFSIATKQRVVPARTIQGVIAAQAEYLIGFSGAGDLVRLGPPM